MNVKSMIVGLVIAVVASTGTYFLVPSPSGAKAASCQMMIARLADALKDAGVIRKDAKIVGD